MQRQTFTDEWTVSVRGSLFERSSGVTGGTTVNLPHDAMLGTGRSADGNPHLGYFHEGTWQYSKKFEVPEEWASKRVTLEFEGAYREAMVFVNGAFAGQWANGYSTFYMAIDPYLFYGGTNEVLVEVQAFEDSRWYSGAGIYRPVNLLVGDLVHIEPTGLRVTTPEIDDDVATVAASTEVINESPITRTVDTVLEVRDASGDVVATDARAITLLPGEKATLRHRSYIHGPRRWNVEEPTLYSARVRIESSGAALDEATTSFGIRTASVDPIRGLRINGETVKLRGACLHHDHGVLGSAEFDKSAERRIRRLKAAGFNAVRSAAKPASRAILDACDRLGMLVLDETWDMWHMSKTHDDYSRRFNEWWERDVDALVAKDFNHPSVIGYSIGSEIIEIGTPHGARWSRQIAERIRSQDDSRFITNSINGMMTMWVQAPSHEAPAPQADFGPAEPDSVAPATSTDLESDVGVEAAADDSFNASLAVIFEQVIGAPRVGEVLAEPAAALDVLGLNYGDVRYELDKVAFPNRVMLGTETFNSRIALTWKMILDNEHVIGDFTWVGWDYLGEPGVGRPKYPGEDAGFTEPYPGLTGNCADIDLSGNRNPVSYYREIVFGLRKDPYLSVQRPEHRDHPARPNAWAWSDTVESWTWDLPEDSPVTVEAYGDADEIAFILNGDEVARAEVGTEFPFMATAEIPYRRGAIEAVSYKAGAEVGRFALSSAAEVTQIGLLAESDELLTDTQDVLYVDISLLDENGTLDRSAEVPVTVSVEGPVILQGLGTARPSTTESFLDSACTTYQGRALAVLRYAGIGGEDATSATITVAADGLPTQSLTVSLTQPA
ncbi:glycoside hydrolase family 2 TIM barrel-domain containing protein [Amnibacterium flavum]|uniref:Glycoside hydrolase family 2 n=1 Tax=Amnibacterium flavum TaxID=2173173 RepID=A0A2V1HQH9_9MICO|nr:glycoside hydrolase family 2 TIM barrel-domain containing protein [Amnibacterium flavum]PVZ93230.1 glycoside hydrolase family 2 [Amnibacterium flavum]